VARALDDVWRDLGDPDPFVVVEAGAGRGRLASDVLRAQPACAPGAALRAGGAVAVAAHGTARAARPRAARRGARPRRRRLDVDDAPAPVQGMGPIVTSLDALPAVAARPGVVIANELLDNLPCTSSSGPTDGWSEVLVGEADGSFRDVSVAAAPDLAREADLVAETPRCRSGARCPCPGRGAVAARRRRPRAPG
jgi:hypothetical protein